MATLAAQAMSRGAPAEEAGAIGVTYHRLMLVMLLFAGVTLLITMRLLYLQVFTDRPGTVIGNPLIPARADIVDRNGIRLAGNIEAWSIAVHPKKLLGDPDEVSAKLAELMPERSVAEYRRILGSDQNFV